MYNDPPTATEVRSITTNLAGVDFTAFSDEQIESAVTISLLYAESLTGWNPLLAPEDSSWRTFHWFGDMSGNGRLVLPLPITEIATVEVGNDPETNTGGTALTYNKDWYKDEHASNVLVFVFEPPRGHNSVRIYQRWGGMTSFPDDLWTAIANYAVAVLLAVQVGSAGGAVEIAQDTVRYRFEEAVKTKSDVMAGGPVALQFYFAIRSVCARYRRMWH